MCKGFVQECGRALYRSVVGLCTGVCVGLCTGVCVGLCTGVW